MDILRFITAGNVDDGKSTLIGRLLYDTQNIKADELLSVSGESMNLAFITDGLRAEREGGITIDVAYKYFTTRHRKYIIIDAPGHFQYTRNLVTGASGADAMIILIDAENGITEQTRRHLLAASFLNINQVAVAVNKMDLAGYDKDVFHKIRNDFMPIAARLALHHLTFIPVSALHGDNVSFRSANMAWYDGVTLMQYLEGCKPANPPEDIARFSVQYAIHSDKEGFEKGYAGKMLSGAIRSGDAIGIYPGGTTTVIRKILHGYDEVMTAKTGENITLYFENDTEARRGNIISHQSDSPQCGTKFEATICWLNALKPLSANTDYFLRMNGTETLCRITEIVHKIDVHSFEPYLDDAPISVNQFAMVNIETRDIIVFDPFGIIPGNGRGIVLDIETNSTSGAFVI